MDQAVRNKLRNVVTQCRKALEDATAQALQGRFGIYPARRKGEVQIEDESRTGHLSDEDRACRQDLIEHLNHIQAIGYKPREALDQLVREIAFTHLNRLCAYKMMEARGLIREAVSRGMKSQGFFFYLADHSDDEKLHKTGHQDAAYRNFLDWLGGTLSDEIGVLFNPNDPANRIYPPQRVLDEVLRLINGEDLNGIWTEDETIGWVYQYFTPKELRDQARKESQAPRNSYELAFRNQFFTPRYVVEFLTDNTLGRIWYEMRKGETVIKDRCRYLVRRPKEVFLKEGEEPPAEAQETRDDLSQDELLRQPVYIPHRSKKDPREIKVLDPACGSGHFLLYCFDLLQAIYEETYDDLDLGPALKQDYPTLHDLRREMPGLILGHNLHGIDIDLRATQIAALALWLRCQRAYQGLGLKNGERPKITRSNIVCAEPMPGEADLLKEFTATLQPKVLGQLVEVIFEKMKLAGEAGSLLKIEREIQEAVATAKEEYAAAMRRRKAEVGYLPGMAPPREATLFDFADMNDEAFLDRAEGDIVTALRQYAEQKANGKAFRRQLFAEDAARGFAFVDVCREQFDVVLMNPPFGLVPQQVFEYLQQRYPDTYVDVYGAFVVRGSQFARDGLVGAITSRSFITSKKLERWRRNQLLYGIDLIVDLGRGVMDDALIDSATYIVRSAGSVFPGLLAIDLRRQADKGQTLQDMIRSRFHSSLVFDAHRAGLEGLPGSRMLYSASDRLAELLRDGEPFEPSVGTVRKGLTTFDDFRFLKLRWELFPSEIGKGGWEYFAKGGEYAKYYTDVHLCVNRKDDGAELAEVNIRVNGQTAQSRQGSSYYYRPGCQYTGRSAKGFSARAIPADCVMSSNAPLILSESSVSPMYLLGWVNSRLMRAIIQMQAMADDYVPGIVKSLPWARPTDGLTREIENRTRCLVDDYRRLANEEETDPLFCGVRLGKGVPLAVAQFVTGWSEEFERTKAVIVGHQRAVTDAIDDLYGLQSEGLGEDVIETDVTVEVTADLPGEREWAERILSWVLGSVLGRWDIRFARGERQPPELPDPFAPLPVCPPGMLQGLEGLPAKPEDVPSDYPLRIDWDGILVDDPEQDDDIVRRVRDGLEIIWKDRAEAVEEEACGILGVRELRDYFRKPGNGGFWMDHVKRYSKSRRKAPIYWYLRSAKGNYGLWLYYHRLDKDILFKALLNYVEPKIHLEEDRLNTLRARKDTTGSSGREAKQIEKDMDRQEQFVSELHDFKDKLRRAADLHLTPDLNDGVVLNVAPLWELVPWKEAKKYWEELAEGKYEWSSIGKQLREKELVKA